MPKVAELPGKLSVHQFHKDHDPPHFHVRRGGSSARLRIADLAPLPGGSLAGRDLRDLLTWARDHQPDLAFNWVLAKAGLDMRDIPCP